MLYMLQTRKDVMKCYIMCFAGGSEVVVIITMVLFESTVCSKA